MSKNTRLDFSPVTHFRSRLAPVSDRRLMLGLTARHVRRDLPTFSSITDSPISGLQRSSSLLDRLQSSLTRYHE